MQHSTHAVVRAHTTLRVCRRRLLADWMGWRAGVAVYPPMLRGKVAIVTGANSGLGLETTKALLQVCALSVGSSGSLGGGHVMICVRRLLPAALPSPFACGLGACSKERP